MVLFFRRKPAPAKSQRTASCLRRGDATPSFQGKTRSTKKVPWFALLTLTLLAIAEAHAATIVGKVSNPDGAAISGAQATIRSGNSEDSWTVMTAEDAPGSLGITRNSPPPFQV